MTSEYLELLYKTYEVLDNSKKSYIYPIGEIYLEFPQLLTKARKIIANAINSQDKSCLECIGDLFGFISFSEENHQIFPKILEYIDNISSFVGILYSLLNFFSKEADFITTDGVNIYPMIEMRKNNLEGYFLFNLTKR